MTRMPAGIAHVTLTDVLKGDPRTITVEVVDGEGAAVALDGATWASTVRRSPQSSTGIDLTIDTSQAADGVLGLTMSGDQTRTLSRGGIYGDLEGSTFGTILTFDAPVRDDVTRGASEPTGGLVDAITVIYDDTGTTLSETVLALLVGTHPDLATHDALGLATDDELVAEQTARADADTALAVRLDTVETTLPLKADLVGGVVPTAQMPAISIMERVPVADEAARLLLANPGDVQIGDVAVQADTGTTWLLVADDPSLAGSWKAIDQADAVSSVNGQTGTVVLGKADVGLGNVDNTADLSKPISTATQTALDAKAPTASPALTGNPTAPTQTAGNDSTRIATTAFVKGAVDNATSPPLPLLKAVLTASQSVPASTVTKIAFNAERWDTDGAFASGTYTAPRAMKVEVAITAVFEANGTGSRRLVRIHHNGLAVGRQDTAPIAGAAVTTLGCVTDVQLAAGDTVEAYVFHDSSGPLLLQASNNLTATGANIAAFMTISRLVEAA